MNADDVSHLIEDQVGGRETLPNSRGIDFRRCLTKPTLIKIIDRRVVRGGVRVFTETVWLVWEESTTEKDGYKIIFSEERGMFGLTTMGFPEDPFPVLSGYYGDFPSTLASM